MSTFGTTEKLPSELLAPAGPELVRCFLAEPAELPLELAGKSPELTFELGPQGFIVPMSGHSHPRSRFSR